MIITFPEITTTSPITTISIMLQSGSESTVPWQTASLGLNRWRWQDGLHESEVKEAR